MSRTENEPEYDIALSFAGEDRPHAEEIASALMEKGVRVFYDRYEQARLWGKDLYQHLQYVYRDSARYCVILISADYASQLWTRHELRHAQARAFEENEEYILPLQLDDTEIPGIDRTVGYVDLRTHSHSDVVRLLLAKLGKGIPSVAITRNLAVAQTTPVEPTLPIRLYNLSAGLEWTVLAAPSMTTLQVIRLFRESLKSSTWEAAEGVPKPDVAYRFSLYESETDEVPLPPLTKMADLVRSDATLTLNVGWTRSFRGDLTQNELR